MASCDIAILGAGPYGLSAAAHLRAANNKVVRVFGECMSFWESHMPVGMFLRSPWAATHLSDPRGELTLDAFKSINGNHLSAPVPLDRFIEYGRWFQRRAVPDVDPRKVAAIEAESSGFRLTLEDGEVVKPQRVIVASGIIPFAWRPSQFRSLSPEFASHSSEHRDLGGFGGRRLVVVGGGQSALESAALLHEAGAEVEVIVRSPVVRWLHQNPLLHTWPVSALLYAWPDVGPAVVSHVVARPSLFRQLPGKLQDRLGPRSIRPAGANWLKPRLQNVAITTSRSVKAAVPFGGHVKLILDDGSERVVDHVLLATGYRVDIGLYPFLSGKLLAAIRRINGYPQLDSGFESSVPGLHFLGAPAALSFGPLLRFVAGAEFASLALTRKILGKRANGS
jgi:FAD-dependent urate hydroxylase